MPFLHQRGQGRLGEMKSTDDVLLAGVMGTGIDKRCHSQLSDAFQTLEERMSNDAAEQSSRHIDETIDGVVDGEVLVGHSVWVKDSD